MVILVSFNMATFPGNMWEKDFASYCFYEIKMWDSRGGVCIQKASVQGSKAITTQNNFTLVNQIIDENAVNSSDNTLATGKFTI